MATCPRWHPTNTPSGQEGSQGSSRRQSRPVLERLSQQTRGHKRTRTEATAEARDIGQPPPQRTAPPSRRDVRAPLLACGLNTVGYALDSIASEELAQCVFGTVKERRPQHRSHQLGLAVQFVIRFFLRPQRVRTAQSQSPQFAFAHPLESHKALALDAWTPAIGRWSHQPSRKAQRLSHT